MNAFMLKYSRSTLVLKIDFYGRTTKTVISGKLHRKTGVGRWTCKKAVITVLEPRKSEILTEVKVHRF